MKPTFICAIVLASVFAMAAQKPQAVFSIPTISPKKQNIAQIKQYYATISADESRNISLSVRVDGFIQKLFVDKIYTQVAKGEPLFSLYSAELIDAQSEFLATRNRLSNEKLALLGVDSKEIDKIAKTHKILNEVTFYAPIDGVVFTKNVNVGSGVKKGDEVFRIINLDKVWAIASINQEDLAFLKNMGGYAIDRNTGKGWLTAAGLLMFGKGLSVRDRFDNIRMDYIDESNLLPGSRWSDRLTYDGMWENNLYNFIRQVTPRLVAGLKRPFRLEGMVRVDDTPVHKSIREAVTNMAIHADYLITGILKIVKTEKGFVFSNPGTLKLPLSAIYEGGYSVARNPRIQTMFRMIGYGDNIGSGFPAILSAWGEESWRKPDLSQNEELHQVELKL